MLQIVRGEGYQSNYNLLTEKTEKLPATRGNIYDRNGVLLAYNRLAYKVTIEDSGIYNNTAEKNKALNAELYEIISNIERCGNEIDNDFGIIMNSDGTYSFTSSSETAQLRFRADVFGHAKTHDLGENKKIGLNEKTCTEAEIIDYLESNKKFGISSDYDAVMRYKIAVLRYNMSLNSYQKYIATTIASDVNEQTVAYIKEHSDILTGVSIEEDSMRQYNYAESTANIIGYTGTISSEEYNALIEKDPDNIDNYSLTDVVGKSGIEQYMNDYLTGTKGERTVYVDNVGNEIKVAQETKSIPGNDTYISIDANIQESTYKLLEQEVAGIVLSKLANIREYKVSDDSKDILIPIYDAYISLLKNGLLSVNDMGNEDATDLEKEVYNILSRKNSDVLDHIRSELNAAEPTVYEAQDEENQDYSTYIIRLLKSKKVLVEDKIDDNDETQKNWSNQKLSVEEYLKYCISQDWIDINAYQTEKKYSDSDEMYISLVDYIINTLSSDSAFKRLVYEYAVRDDLVSGNQLCALLYDQGVLKPDDAARESLLSGKTSAYNFIKEKLKNLEITPGQLALDPCSASAVVIDPNDGSLLACVSYPGYDTNKLANNVDRAYYTYLNTTTSSPLYNHATQQMTAPGSTFKPLSATAGLAEGVIDTSTLIDDLGIFDKVSNEPRCWIYPSNHGEENVSDAIRDSCNYFFYEVGWRLAGGNGYNDKTGIAKIQKYASLYGLDRKTGIEIDENTSHVATQYPVMAAIGQSDNNYTTIALGRYATAITNSGKVYKLTLLDKVVDADGNEVQSYAPEVESTVDVLSASQWSAIHTGMREVVENMSSYEGFPIEVAGKTGTAQESKKRPNHALFIGFAPYTSPKYTVAVRIPFGYTSHNAADVAKDILGVCFNLEESKAKVGAAVSENGTGNVRTD
ncbi:MAG: penicillin-binding transpeptidase domain-containing protein [Lachnospiraceae bacterium]|nr:penicillin-binding transpeptidase domain-containing protein [Lachnospiraceae bacterium]